MRLLRDDTPMLMIWLQKIRTRSKSDAVRTVIVEAERRCRLYDEFLAAARVGDGKKLRLLVEAAEYVPLAEREKHNASK